MIINLADIPEEGRAYDYNRQTAELNEALKDLIEARPYEVKFFIKPMASGFEMTGQFRTALPEQCSRCGDDFEFGAASEFREILIAKQEDTRTSHYARPNHFSDLASDGTEFVEYFDDQFNVGEYIHEAIALTVPVQAVPPEDAKGNCSLCHKFVRGTSFSYDETMSENKQNPFSQLKGLKF